VTSVGCVPVERQARRWWDYAKWSGNPTITRRHKIEPGSPFYKEIEDPNSSPEMCADENSSSNTDEAALPQPQPSSASKKKMIGVSCIDDVVQVGVCITDTDLYGAPIVETRQYTPLDNPFTNMVLSPTWGADNHE